MRTVCLLFLFLGIVYLCSAQTTTVTDRATGEPLVMATLSSEQPKVFAITDENGQVELGLFREATAIEISSLGYESLQLSYYELEQRNFKIRLQPTDFSFDQVVISATRWRQSSGNVPMKISTISEQEVALQNPQTAADLLGASGEVFIQKSQQGGGSPMIRGFSSNRLLYAVDGVRMNTAIFRAGNLQNVISLDPFAIEKTEVFFGPGSVIYGSDAIGGVMSFQTLTPELTQDTKQLTKGKAVARFASANEEFSGHFDVNVGWQKWALVTSISANSYGDLRMGNNGPSSYLRPSFVERFDSTDVVVNNSDPQLQVPSGFDQINLMQKLRFKPSEKWDIEYGFHYSETTPYSRYDRQLRTRNGLPRYGEWAYGPQIWMMNNLSATHTHPNLIFDQFTLRAAHQYFEESRISRNFNSPDRAIRTEQVDAYSLNLDFSKKWDSNTTLFYGLEWVLNQVNSTGLNENINTGTTSPGPSRYPQADWQSYAAYLTAQIQLNEQLHLQAGARYGRNLLNATFDTTFFPFPFTTTSLNAGATTGSLGLVYRPTSTWVLSATIANGFRAPNVDDAGKVFDSEPGAVVVPNPNLRPEFAYNVELGLAKIIGDFIKLDVTAYYTFLDNALVRRNFTLNGQDSILYENQPSQVQAIQNAASANVYGVQAGVEVKLPNGFRLATRLNYQVGEEELNDGTRSPSRHAAPFFGLARLNYRKDKLQLQFNIQFSDAVPFEDMPVSEIGKPEIYAQDANGNPFSPSWYTLNFKALYQLEQHFSLSAGLENITDQRYRPYSSGLVAPGRNFILALRAEF